MNEVEKPIERSTLRRLCGREYYILKRKVQWLFSSTKFSKVRDEECPYKVIEHKSMLLRKLKDVDMYLQHNKITNLRLAIAKIDGVVIRPGETFLYGNLWVGPLVARGTKRV